MTHSELVIRMKQIVLEPSPAVERMAERIMEWSQLLYDASGVQAEQPTATLTMAKILSGMTEAYRMECRDRLQQIAPISASEMYKSPTSPSCRQCGQATDHFFTSQRDQSVLCEACFGERETKQLAKDVTKSKHPLDAWMGT